MSDSRFAELRARRALESARRNSDAPLRRLASVTNEVWDAGDVVVRVNRRLHSRLRREADLAALLPPEVQYPTTIATGDGRGADWTVVTKARGVPLMRSWPAMSVAERRRAVVALASALRALHAVEVPPGLAQMDGAPQLLRPGALATEPVLLALDRVADLPHVDGRVVDEAVEFVRCRRSALDPFEARTLIHGDLHFQNVLWDGEDVTALLDLEFARGAPPDLDLDVFLRFCAFPYLFLPEGREHEARPMDYVEVPAWLREVYPELFARRDLIDRLRLYAIGFLARELLTSPPTGPASSLRAHHPYRRLLAILRMESHLDYLPLS